MDTNNLPRSSAHQELVRSFAAKVRESDGAAEIWFSGADYMWHVRAETPDGMFNLETPSGTGFQLESLLRILAGEGVNRIMLDFNGLSPFYYDR